ncbi:uncharacterized protein LOC135824918 isoform X2 [Sycon ciliatum]|uniref:uncharacterized protein LOC135824918 isoform X2 n=1 Tax=Sycon ciliatum TaxID=27933 RepID=UPI0031F67BBE
MVCILTWCVWWVSLFLMCLTVMPVMAAVNVDRILWYATEDKVEDLKAAILEGGVLKEEIKLQKDARGDPLLAKLLRSACRRNATSVVKFLVNIVGRNVLNGAGEDKCTPLHCATDGNKADCVLHLLHAGANPDQPDICGRTPLHYASWWGHIDCMRHLLDNNANPNQPDLDRRTPLHRATIGNKADCVLHLLHAGANPDPTDIYGRTPLHYASEWGYIDCLRHLLDNNANPNQPDLDQCTPLHLATFGNKTDCVLHLLHAGANPDQPDKWGKTPLHSASDFGHIDCMQHLLDSNANPSQPDKNGDTPLDIAAKQNGPRVVKYLVSYVLRKTTKDQCRTLLVQAYNKSLADCRPVLQDGIMDCLVGVHISQEDMDAWTELLGRLSKQRFLELTQEAITIRKELPPPLLQVSTSIRRKTNQQSPLVVRLLGHPGGGKSSLLKSILRRRRFFGKVKNIFRGDQCDTILASRTRGMRRYVDDGTIYLDLGGQYRFMSQHQRLTKFSDVWALNLLMVSGMESIVNMRRWIRTWADFIVCSCAEGTTTHNKALIVVTRRDRLSKERMTAIEKECATLQKVLGVHLEFLDEPIPFVNAISETCEGVAALKELIQRHKEKMQQAPGPVSEVVASISEAHLENVRDQCRDSPAISTDQFVELLATAIARFDYNCDDSLTPVVLKALKEVLDVNMELYNLHQKALVFYFPDAKLVVVQPLWLMSDITGKFYSPKSFPPPIIICDEFGFASHSHVIEVLAKDSPVRGEDALDIAVRLGMCHVTEDGEQVMILPAQAESRTSLHWEKANPDQHIYYTGRRLYCRSGVAISAALMPTIQISLVNSFTNRTRKFPVWQGGVRVSLTQYVNTDTLVEIPHGQLALNIITRGPDQRSVTSQQETIWDHISALPRQQSPGSDMSTVFVDDGCLPSSELLRQRDLQGDLNATMEFLASERLRAQFVMPDEREPDTRKYHPYAVSTSCCNADTVEERRRAARLCSAFYQHRILLRPDFPLRDCLLKLIECGQVNTSFLDDVDDCLRKHQAKMAADLFRGSISDLPDSVVLTLVDEVLPKIASAKDLYQAMLECPGRVLCTVSPSDSHSTTAASDDVARSATDEYNPWDHPDFCLDKYRRWIISLNSRTFRDKVIARRLLADNLIIRRFIELERRDGSDVHNEQLLQHMQGFGRASFIIFLDIITDMNSLWAFKRTEFEALLHRP